MEDKHWTLKIADENFKLGFKYTVFPRGGTKVSVPIKNLRKFYDALCEIRPAYKEKEDLKFALRPEVENCFYIMYYPNDETYWVVGYVREGTDEHK